MDLLQRFAAGDPDAFEALFREHQGEVYRWIVRIVRDPAVAEELTLEALWRLYQARGRLDPRGNCAGWLRRVATNLAIDQLRRAKPFEPLSSDPPGRPEPDGAEQRQERAAIHAALAQLSPRLRIVVRLGLIEDQPYAAIAESLGISTGAVKLRMFRALRILRKDLEQRGVRP